jgi:hypothetical protein
VIVGADRRPAPHFAAQQLDSAVGDDLVGVHIGRGAGAGLEDIDRELVVPSSCDHLVAGLCNGVGQSLIQQP